MDFPSSVEGALVLLFIETNTSLYNFYHIACQDNVKFFLSYKYTIIKTANDPGKKVIQSDWLLKITFMV